MRHLFAILALAAAPLAAQTGRLPTCDTPPMPAVSPIVIPIYRYADLNFVKVCVGERELDFILDTGASFTGIDYSLGKRIGLYFGDSTFGVGGTGPNVARGYLVQKGSIRVAGTSITDPIRYAVDLHPTAKYSWHVLDGVLGYDFIRQHVVAIDYPKHELRFYNPKTFRFSGKGVVVPITIEDRVPYVDLNIKLIDGDSLRGRFLVDAGSTLGISLSAPFVEAHAVRNRVGNVVRPSGVSGVGGVAQRVNGRLAGISVMGMDLPNTDVTIFGDSATALKEKDKAGAIGARILSKYVVYFDYRGKRMILEPPL
jgi:hypothetical protein